MFRTKINFDLMDCYNNIVFSSELGSSSEKEFKKGLADGQSDKSGDSDSK